MLSFIKKNADWFIIASHSFMLFFVMFISITDMDISGWLFIFLIVYVLLIVYGKVKKTKTFKRWCARFKIKK
jgi:amino acid transporter